MSTAGLVPEARREAARRIRAVMDVWPHSSATARATLAAVAIDLDDDTVDCLGCDLAAAALLGIDAADLAVDALAGADRPLTPYEQARIEQDMRADRQRRDRQNGSDPR